MTRWQKFCRVAGIVVVVLVVLLVFSVVFKTGQAYGPGSATAAPAASGDPYERHNDDVARRGFDQYGNRR